MTHQKLHAVGVSDIQRLVVGQRIKWNSQRFRIRAVRMVRIMLNTARSSFDGLIENKKKHDKICCLQTSATILPILVALLLKMNSFSVKMLKFIKLF